MMFISYAIVKQNILDNICHSDAIANLGAL